MMIQSRLLIISIDLLTNTLHDSRIDEVSLLLSAYFTEESPFLP